MSDPNVKSILSEEFRAKLGKNCWYHGSNQVFDSWKIPSPRKPGEDFLVPHDCAIFFTSNLDYAKRAGNKIAKVAISEDSNILDMTKNYEASENLRLLIQAHDLMSKTLNVEREFWHEGWKTGDVLRLAYINPVVGQHMEKVALDLSKKSSIPLEIANLIIQHNSSRGLIELICQSAKELGFDGLYGFEVDRHSDANKKVAQPWLAVFSNNIVSAPKWF